MVNTLGSISGCLALLFDYKCIIAAMNRNEAFKASSASYKSLFAIAVDYDYLVWLVVLDIWLASFNEVVI